MYFITAHAVYILAQHIIIITCMTELTARGLGKSSKTELGVKGAAVLVASPVSSLPGLAGSACDDRVGDLGRGRDIHVCVHVHVIHIQVYMYIY